MLTTQQPKLLHNCIEIVSGPFVIVPVARRSPIYRAGTSDDTVKSMNRQVEVTTERFVEFRLAIRRPTADVRRFQIHINHEAHAHS